MSDNAEALELPFFAFDDRASAYAATADALAASVIEAHENGRRARIALSGGSSPTPAYTLFAAMDLDWSRVDIALVDDRWVNVSEAGSNEAMIRTAFAEAQSVTIFGMKTSASTPFEGAKERDAVYAALRPFDAVVMGMGPDAHTASWFSGSPQLEACLSLETEQTLLGVDASQAPVAGAYPLRMTVTLPVIAEVEQVIFVLFGDDKRQTLISALNTPVTQAPIRAVLDACAPRCVVIWSQ